MSEPVAEKEAGPPVVEKEAGPPTDPTPSNEAPVDTPTAEEPHKRKRQYKDTVEKEEKATRKCFVYLCLFIATC